jgi:hypothetical protein
MSERHGEQREEIDVSGRGSIFGFEVMSDLDFSYLRDGSGSALEVRQEDVTHAPDAKPILEWVRRPENPFEATLYGAETGYIVSIPGIGSYAVDPDAAQISVPSVVDPVPREERLWGIPAALSIAARGDVPLHASAVDVGGRALVFCGPSRFGKTTLAAGFLHAGYRVLSEDLTCCRLGPVPAVLPGPAMLRVRRDVYERMGAIAGTHITAEEADRVHLAFEDGLRGSGEPVPLAGVVLLKRGLPTLELDRVDATRFLPELFTMSFNLPSDADRARCFSAVVDLATTAPLWLLDRPLRFDLFDSVIDQVVETCLA